MDVLLLVAALLVVTPLLAWLVRRGIEREQQRWHRYQVSRAVRRVNLAIGMTAAQIRATGIAASQAGVALSRFADALRSGLTTKETTDDG